MICDKCGSSNPENSRFCNNCGNQLHQRGSDPESAKQHAPISQNPVIGMRPLVDSQRSPQSNVPTRTLDSPTPPSNLLRSNLITSHDNDTKYHSRDPQGFEGIEYFNDGKVIVTSTQIISSEHTYSLSKVASVSMGIIKIAMLGLFKWVLWANGVLISFIGLLMIKDIEGWIVLALGGFFIASGIFTSRRANQKCVYTARIGFDLLEEDIAKSTDQEYIQKIINAVNEAVRNRG